MQYNDFMEVLDLIKNPAVYEARVAELVARNQAIQESITQLGVVGDVAKAKKAVEAQKAKVDAALDKAQVEADAIVAAAKVAYDKRHEELKAREVVSDQALTNYNTIKSQITQRENDVRQAEKAIAVTQLALTKEKEELAIKQAEVEARLEKLRQAMG